VAVTGRAVLKALVASFSVYLLPMFTVHIFYFWGWAIGAELLSDLDRGGGWIEVLQVPSAAAGE
jgi:hypothetical protein